MALGQASRPYWHTRITLAVLTVAGIVLTYALIYQWAVWAYTGVEISFIHAVHVVIEALTTAGFGGDTHLWRESEALLALVILMNISGVVLVFLAIPLFVFPLFRELLASGPPTSSDLTSHVVICGFSPQDEVLSEELEAANIPYLYIDPDAEVVTQLTQEGIDAIVGNPQESEALQAANVESAMALVADIDDEVNPAVLLSAKQINPDVRTISVIRDPEVEPYHRFAKADEVVLSRHVLGEGLGHRAAGTFAEKLRDQIEVESDIEITELRIEHNSDLVGKTLREAVSLDRLGITVIGAWMGGKFLIAPHPDTEIQSHTIFLVAGKYRIPDNVKAVKIPEHVEEKPRVVVCGYGTVGRAITETLRREGLEAETIDLEEKPGVDVVGDIANPDTFRQVDLERARAVVLSIDEDVTTIYATLILNDMAPETEIIVRADDARSVQEMYNAGADFVLSLPEVTGEFLASLLIEDADIVTPDIDFEFKRVRGTAFASRSLRDLDIRQQTGCTVVVVERNGDLLTELTGAFVIEARDNLIIAGSPQAHERFEEWATDVAPASHT